MPEIVVPCMAEVGVIGFAGTFWTRVQVVGETPKSYRIVAINTTFLPGRRELKPGTSALVPKNALRACSD